MFKIISAALFAVSVLAAPALAATSAKTDPAAVTQQAPIKTTVKSSALSANAKMDGHHASHHKHYRHLSHHKTHATHTKVSFKQIKPSTKRG